ncbi:MAG: hypothetical protein ABI696_06880 [Rubrivivax sp.]
MLKVIFGALGLLIVLAIVGSLAKNQLGAPGQLGQTATRAADATAGTSDSSSTGSMAGKAVGGARLDAFGATAGIGAEGPDTAQAQIKGIQQSVRDRTNNALQQGTERNSRAQP